MRLDASKFGLFAGLLGVVTGSEEGTLEGARPSDQALIDFGDTFTRTRGVLSPNAEMAAEIIWVPYDSDLAVTNLFLYRRRVGDGENDALITDHLIAESNMTTDFYLEDPNQDISYSEQGVLRLPSMESDSADRTNMTEIPLNSGPNFLFNELNPHVLYMKFDLRNDTHTGEGYSPPFVVIGTNDESQRAAAISALSGVPSPVEPGDVRPIATTTGSSTGSSPTLDPNLAPGSPSPGDDFSQTSPPEGDSSEQSPNRLRGGAIAGIVVGICVGFLAIAGLLVWFCLRRRQSGRPLARARAVGYGSDSGAIAMMPEKEAAGLTESSSHPVYDHPSAPVAHHAAPVAHQAAPVAHHNDPTAAADSYAPYSDHVVAPGTAVTTPTPTSLNEPSPVLHEQQQQGPGGETSAARQHQQQPVTSRYAHLVEEGMTEEEIRRLEEEERQLDAAIEEAGQRQSQAPQ
ncbi:hypothetical protein DL768_001574 [Monosporascus sp. mg162]|nr:hypothetical protein DL768_001574 [Monosporascus sp. mg162]